MSYSTVFLLGLILGISHLVFNVNARGNEAVSIQKAKYIMLAKVLPHDLQSRAVRNATVGSSVFHLISDLTSDELEKYKPMVSENGPMTPNSYWYQNRIITRTNPGDDIDLENLSKPKRPRPVFPNITVNNVNVYIIDTGVDLNHVAFKKSRVRRGLNFGGDEDMTDCTGHGTSVASLAVGSHIGIAQGANLFSLKTMNCNTKRGSAFSVVEAIAWAVQHAKSTGLQSVINLSWSSQNHKVLNELVKATFLSGVFIVSSAGNKGTDACDYSPGSSPYTITVGSVDLMDRRAPSSNYGPCVTVFAPGVELYAAVREQRKLDFFSGTSAATPIVTGTLAVYLSRYGRAGYEIFKKNFVENRITNLSENTPNKLVYLDPLMNVSQPLH